MHEIETTQTPFADTARMGAKAPPTPSITLILPAYNEAEVIADAITEADSALSSITSQYEIIVIDDGSHDATAETVREFAKFLPSLRLVQHPRNQGYGAAIRTGFSEAKCDLVVFTDADCQFDLTELDRFVLLSERYDIVCGYRIDRKDSSLRCLYSRVYNLLVRAMLNTGVRDVDCALKMFHRDVAKKLRLTGDGFLVNSEMLTQAKRFGHSVVEVGVSHRPRMLGESTVSIKHIPTVLASLVRYWWNEVQFPVPEHVDCQEPKATSASCFGLNPKWLQIGLLFLAAMFMFANLGYPLIDRDETRYAEIPREMIATGNWVLPQLNFETYYDKPPLLYWLCAISFKLFGISEVSARLVPAFAAICTLASTMFFGSRLFGRTVGLHAGVVLLLSVGFAFTSRYLLLDGVLALFVSLSLFAALEAIRNPTSTGAAGTLQLRWWILSGVCIGLAFLTKGPIAIVLWLPPVLAMTWVSEAHARPAWWHYGVLGGVASMIAAPWFLLVHLEDTTFLNEFFYRHNIARFAGEFHPKPIWYFLPVLLIAGHPWSFLTIPYAKFLMARDERSRRQRPPAIGYLLLWSGWCFAFFSMSSCKLPTYLLPAAPALALMVGHYLHTVLGDASHPQKHFFARFWSARSATASTCFAGVAFVVYAMIYTDDATAVLFAWAMLWAALLISSLVLMADRHQARIAWGTSAVFAFLFAVMVMHQMVPAYSRSQTLFGESSPLANQLGVDESTPIATIEHEFSEVPFYLNRANIAHFAHLSDQGIKRFLVRNSNCILIVDSHIAIESLRDQLPAKIKIAPLLQRGPAALYRVSAVPIVDQVAQRATLAR
ncbi:membrane protein containing Glycosyl transferase, family 2 domain protein [Rhodopirellula islandica]|uniref:Membrane protein containing Glycosyl transferase, family 2 domain protein n=1 Tax=Rhodopirellula islandica TaxID=595434 RepID=A0A0J1BMN8_RHOIS|nr:glycosyltransferase [Rhodopirellula islandica]KLU07786.1 membrane protein containing Glycosyl transferase, family 2 domain protein [Rhodopirellula islandica]